MDAAALAERALAACQKLETHAAARGRRVLAPLRPALEAAYPNARGELRFGIAVGLDACFEQSAERERHLALLDDACGSLPHAPHAHWLAYRAARIEFLRGHRERAFERAERLQRASPGGDDLAADAMLIESAALRNLSAAADALKLANAALRQARSSATRMRAHFHRAAALHVLGRLDEVEAAAKQALALTIPLGAARQRALVLLLLGLHASAIDRPALACEFAAESARRFSALGDRIMTGKALGMLAAFELASGERRARATLARAARVVHETGDRATLTELAVVSAEQRLSGARVRLRECLWDNQALGVTHLAERAACALESLDAEATSSLTLSTASRQANFSERGQRRVIELARHEKPWRVLCALAQAKLAGAPQLGVAELLSAVWPGERLLAHAGQNRVYAAIRHLRRAGSSSLIRSSSSGYELVCAVRFVP